MSSGWATALGALGDVLAAYPQGLLTGESLGSELAAQAAQRASQVWNQELGLFAAVPRAAREALEAQLLATQAEHLRTYGGPLLGEELNLQRARAREAAMAAHLLERYGARAQELELERLRTILDQLQKYGGPQAQAEIERIQAEIQKIQTEIQLHNELRQRREQILKSAGLSPISPQAFSNLPESGRQALTLGILGWPFGIQPMETLFREQMAAENVISRILGSAAEAADRRERAIQALYPQIMREAVAPLTSLARAIERFRTLSTHAQAYRGTPGLDLRLAAPLQEAREELKLAYEQLLRHEATLSEDVRRAARPLLNEAAQLLQRGSGIKVEPIW